MNFTKTGQVLYLLAFALSVTIETGTYFLNLDFVYFLPVFVGCFLAVICSKAAAGGIGFHLPSSLIRYTGFVIFVYAIALFIFDYRITGGANGFRSIDGQCFAMNKSTIIRALSAEECRHFHALWVRVMSAWIAATALFGLSESDRVSPKTAR